MKRLIFISLLTFASCSVGKVDPTFDVQTTVKRHSFDESKGVCIQIFPMEKPTEAQ